ncbi:MULTISPECIES: hypothetical protein [Actinosynnema]|nr:hypothetical protein [Actinosynnema pretiosum]MCP2098882.1 hypothetical protein [Actinosynnema pretiosum]
MPITPSALDEVRAGRALPDGEFIAGALIAFEPPPFEALFEISGR